MGVPLDVLLKPVVQIVFLATLVKFAHAYLGYLDSLPLFHNNSFHIFITGTWLLHQLVFWGVNVFFIYLDLSEKPGFLYQYKIQKKKIGTKGHWKCFKLVLFNQVVLLPPMLWIGWWLGEKYCGLSIDPSQAPSILELFLSLIVFALVEEIGFYYSHRGIHSPPFYGWIHKYHHEFKYPVGTASEYAHPIEFVLSNVLPLLSGPLLVGYFSGQIHISSIYFWATLAITATINGHSGFDLPSAPFKSAKFHDLHHEVFKDNYGALGILDYLHGTRRDPATQS